jgi:hypothetical protein
MPSGRIIRPLRIAQFTRKSFGFENILGNLSAAVHQNAPALPYQKSLSTIQTISPIMPQRTAEIRSPLMIPAAGDLLASSDIPPGRHKSAMRAGLV